MEAALRTWRVRDLRHQLLKQVPLCTSHNSFKPGMDALLLTESFDRIYSKSLWSIAQVCFLQDGNQRAFDTVRKKHVQLSIQS